MTHADIKPFEIAACPHEDGSENGFCLVCGEFILDLDPDVDIER